jgi:outer membrane protein assembly factor BamE
MQNTKLLLTSLTLVGLLALAGCSFPGVYKIDIQQGNVVTQDMIDQLRPGMTRRQVRFIMGNPLIQDTFHTNRWDYLYSLQPGGGKRQQERMSIFFNESDQLVSLSGDFMPGVSRDQEILGGSSDTTVSPATEPGQPNSRQAGKTGQARLAEETMQREIDTIETTPVPTPAPLETSP